MSDKRFILTGAAYSEIAKAVKPHISRDFTRPKLTHVQVRFDGKRVAFEATDSYSFIRATMAIDSGIDGAEGEPFDALVPGVHLLGLRPGRTDDVTLRLVEDGRSEITCGVTTVRLDHYDMTGAKVGFPNYDEMLGKVGAAYSEPRASVDMAGGIGLNPMFFAKLSSLPLRLMHARFIGPLHPMFFVASGIARYEGLCEIPSTLIAAGREWLERYCEYPDGEVEAMFPADVYREIEGCWGWERFVRDATLTAQVGWAA